MHKLTQKNSFFAAHRYKQRAVLIIVLLVILYALLANVFGHTLVSFIYNKGYLPSKFTINEYLEVFDIVSSIFLYGAFLMAISIMLADYVILYFERKPFSYSRNNWQYIIVLSILGMLITSLVAFGVLQKFPNSADEYAYVFQAMTFNEGRLWNPTHPGQTFFYFIHIIQNEGKWVSRFPPGWPIVLAAGNYAGVPFWLVNPILSGCVISVFYFLSKRIFGSKVALIATICLASSSFFIFTGASYFSHMTALLLALLFYYHGLEFLKTKRAKYAILAGIWIGFAFITRFYTALLISTPLLVYALIKNQRQVLIGLIFVIIGCFPFLALLLYYNYQITGDPFVLVTQWVHKNETLGFVRGHTWGRAIWNTIHHLIDLTLWASPTFLLLLCAKFLDRKRSIGISNIDFISLGIFVFCLTVVGYAFFYSFGGDQYGPRYYFEAYPFALLALTAWIFGDKSEDVPRVKALRFLYVVGMLWTIMYAPFHIYKEYKVIDERRDVYKLVENKGIENAIVLLRDGTGVIRPMAPGDLTRNGVKLNGDVLYGRDPGEKYYDKLRELFPNRELYRYVRKKESPEGALVEI